VPHDAPLSPIRARPYAILSLHDVIPLPRGARLSLRDALLCALPSPIYAILCALLSLRGALPQPICALLSPICALPLLRDVLRGALPSLICVLPYATLSLYDAIPCAPLLVFGALPWSRATWQFQGEAPSLHGVQRVQQASRDGLPLSPHDVNGVSICVLHDEWFPSLNALWPHGVRQVIHGVPCATPWALL
jgi:hypothetical protein